jgi:hypothetical protein
MPHHLQKQRALTDPRLTADQDQRARYDATAQDPVQLVNAGIDPATLALGMHLL